MNVKHGVGCGTDLAAKMGFPHFLPPLVPVRENGFPVRGLLTPPSPVSLEDALMIYEVRTYTLRPGTLAEFEERYEKRLPLREKNSNLGAFHNTDAGRLNPR